MSPFKLSLRQPRNDDPEETVELDDDDLVGQLREVVDATPDLTMAEALRAGHRSTSSSTGRSGADRARRSAQARLQLRPQGPDRAARAAGRGCPAGCRAPG